MLRKIALVVLLIAVALFAYSLIRDNSQLTVASSTVSGIALILALVTGREKSNS